MCGGNPAAPATGPTYGLRDAVCVLHDHGYRVARRWRGVNGAREFYWTMAPPPVGGRRGPARVVSWAELEAEAGRHERLIYRR